MSRAEDRTRPDPGRRSLARGALFALLAAAGWPAGLVRAHSYKLGDIAVGHLWAPPPAAGADGLPVYGPLLNRGRSTVRLVGASSPVAERVRFRRQQDDATEWPESLELMPMRPLALAAWREHLWVEGLKRSLGDGEPLPLLLDFGPAGKLEADAVIESAAGH